MKQKIFFLDFEDVVADTCARFLLLRSDCYEGTYVNYSAIERYRKLSKVKTNNTITTLNEAPLLCETLLVLQFTILHPLPYS